MYLLDTDICIYFLRGNKILTEKFLLTDPNDLFITSITLSELYYGAYYSQDRNENIKKVKKISLLLNILNFSEGEARIFGEIKSYLRSSNKIIEDFDISIASIALSYDFILVTNNTKHFSRIHNLKIENWIFPMVQ